MVQWRERGGFRIRGGVSKLLACVVVGATAVAARGQALPEGYRAEQEIVYGKVDSKELKLDVYFRPGREGENRAPAAALVRFGPARETPAGPAIDLLQRNIVLVYARYLPGDAGDRVFSAFPQDIHAAKAALRWVKGNAPKYGVDADKIGVWGSGHGATIAALVGLTGGQKELAGTIGDYPPESTPMVRAMCLFEGVTDWRNAELYGDEMVNVPKSPAYQLFGGNPKEHTDEARQASAVNYVRPTSPATLMVTLSSDQQRAMHLIFAETLRKAGVRSALYEEPIGSARGVDEARLNKTVLEFFADTLQNVAAPAQALDISQEVDQLSRGGLFKQARRLIDEQMSSIPGTDANALKQRTPWLRKLREINDQQQEPALRQLLAARKALAAPANSTTPRTLWTIREVLTDPERIGQYSVETSMPQRVYDGRADALRFVETLNAYLLKGEIAAADKQAGVMRQMAHNGDVEATTLIEFLTRYEAIRGKSVRVWPAGIRGVAYANDFGQDLYGYWMDIKAGGVTQRFRYVPPGRYVRGSAKEEWGRLPGEPILEPAEVARGFWLADSEVTQGMWEGVMGRDENHAAFRLGGSNAEVRLKLPVENISYAHAVNFLNKLGIDARLPTEVEWEYACRAGSAFMYSGTGRLSDMGWFWDEKRDKQGVAPTGGAPVLNAAGEADIQILHELETDQSETARLTHPVKMKLPNKWGLYDMQGNVWEWCGGASPDKPRDYHAAKGGSWISIPQSCRSARDAWFPVEHQSWNVGMRICIPAN